MRFVAFLCLWLATAATAHAASIGEVDRAIGAGDLNEARAQAVRLGEAGGGYIWVGEYVDAYVLLADGDTQASVTIARRLLDEQPDNFRVRHLLINGLIAQRDYQGAVFHIRRNLDASSDPAVRAQYRDLLDRYETLKPSTGISATFGANPSTNVTKGSGQETIVINGLPFQVDEASRERAGGTVTLGLSAFRNFAVGEKTDLVISNGVTLEKGVSGSDQDVVTLSPGIRLQRRFRKTLIAAGPIAEIQWLDYEPHAYRFGLSVSALRALTDRTSVTLSMRALTQTYETADFLDGYRISADATLKHRLLPSLAGTLSLKYEHEQTRADHLTYDLGQIGAGLEKQWANGFYTDISVSYAAKDYDADFPIAAFPRRDDRYEAQIGVAHEKLTLFGVMPYVGYRYIRNKSNISLYDYDSNDLVISGRKRF